MFGDLAGPIGPDPSSGEPLNTVHGVSNIAVTTCSRHYKTYSLRQIKEVVQKLEIQFRALNNISKASKQYYQTFESTMS